MGRLGNPRSGPHTGQGRGLSRPHWVLVGEAQGRCYRPGAAWRRDAPEGHQSGFSCVTDVRDGFHSCSLWSHCEHLHLGPGPAAAGK